MSGQGHMVMGATVAGAADHAGCAVASRYAGDPLGSIQPPTIAVASTSSYNAQSGAPQAWGAFSNVAVDPLDDQTMWAFVEYCNATDSWGVRAIRMQAPPPAIPVSANPATIQQGTSLVSVVVTGTSSNGSGFFDTEPGMYPLIATIQGVGVDVNLVTWNSPTQITLTVTVAPDAPLGPRMVTVLNPDGQSTTSLAPIVMVGENSSDTLGVPYCFCDAASLPNPPCFNNGGSTHGCGNSDNGDGAVLSGVGKTNPDRVVLHTSGELSSALTIFLQGDRTISPPAQFGAGLSCVGGTQLRLYTKHALNGAASAPESSDPSITARSAALGDAIAPGSRRYYLVYYRDPNQFFCAYTFNSTNGLAIEW